MKKYLILLLIIISNISLAQNCNIGNEDSTTFNYTGGPILKNFLLGVRFNLSTNGVVTSLDLLGKNTGSQVQMAVYEDNAGVPGNLIVSSNTATVGTGIISLPVTPTQLIAGNYWIMAVYDSDGEHTYRNTSSSTLVYYDSLAFGNAIPSNGSNFLSYSGRDFTYYMEITCGQLGISVNNEINQIAIYPNPANDFFTIKANSTLIGSNYYIIDILGKQILTGKISSETTLVDICQLESGIYFLSVGQLTNQTFKLIKKKTSP